MYFLILISSIITLSLYNNPKKEIIVCPTCEINTITKALKVAQSYDSIIIQEGIYKEGNIIIDKPISIVGKNTPIIDGENEVEILTIISDDVSIEGLKMINTGKNDLLYLAAIKVKKSKNFILSNNIIENSYWGIYIEKSSYGKIQNNTITGLYADELSVGNGIHLWYCSNMIIKDNMINETRDGIYFEFVDDSKIINNISENNLRYGLHFMFSNRDEYSKNQFINNGAGVAVMFSNHIKMNHNIFIDNWGAHSYGLLLKEIYDAKIFNNRFESNTIGIKVDGSSRIDYSHNMFKQNGWAIIVLGGCFENYIKNNDFINNTFDMSYNGQLNDNQVIHNYWNKYKGYDINKDGIGDVPYKPIQLFSSIVDMVPESIVLLRSFFVDIINFAEQVMPINSQEQLIDPEPLTKPNL